MYLQSGRMDSDGVYLIGEEFCQLTGPINVIPQADALICTDSCDERLPNADVHPCNGSLVVVGPKDVKVHLI